MRRRDSVVVGIETCRIRLGKFLKLAGVTATGGRAKLLVRSRSVLVNDIVETRRGRWLERGDRIRVGSKEYQIAGRCSGRCS